MYKRGFCIFKSYLNVVTAPDVQLTCTYVYLHTPFHIFPTQLRSTYYTDTASVCRAQVCKCARVHHVPHRRCIVSLCGNFIPLLPLTKHANGHLKFYLFAKNEETSNNDSKAKNIETITEADVVQYRDATDR